jgi:hypothetical protein
MSAKHDRVKTNRAKVYKNGKPASVFVKPMAIICFLRVSLKYIMQIWLMGTCNVRDSFLTLIMVHSHLMLSWW